MSFYHHPKLGTFHLQEVSPRRQGPAHERHKWSQKVKRRGDVATCQKCGCQHIYLPNYEIVYQMPGYEQQPDRPPCQPRAATAAPADTPASTTPPAPTMLPGLTTTYDEPAPYRHD